MCDFIRYWDDLNDTQKKSLTQRYQSGCACKVCDRNYSKITLHHLFNFYFVTLAKHKSYSIGVMISW